VLSYADRIAGGQAYVYRVIASEERATLSLVRAGGGWQLDQLKAARNSEVRRTTAEMVDEWLGRR